MLLQQHGDVRAVPAHRVLGVEAGLSSVGGKPWADDACLAGLVRAIDDLLQPQAYLCSMGADRRLHGDEIMRMTDMRMTERAREQVNISSKPACSFTPECSISRKRRSGVMPVLGPRNDESQDPDRGRRLRTARGAGRAARAA